MLGCRELPERRLAGNEPSLYGPASTSMTACTRGRIALTQYLIAFLLTGCAGDPYTLACNFESVSRQSIEEVCNTTDKDVHGCQVGYHDRCVIYVEHWPGEEKK